MLKQVVNSVKVGQVVKNRVHDKCSDDDKGSKNEKVSEIIIRNYKKEDVKR